MWNGQGESGCQMTAVGPLWLLTASFLHVLSHGRDQSGPGHHSSERCYGWEPTRTWWQERWDAGLGFGDCPAGTENWPLLSPRLLQADGHHCHHLGHQHIEVHPAIKWNRFFQDRTIFQENGERKGLGHSVKQEMSLTKRQRAYSPPPQLIWSSQFPINVLFPLNFKPYHFHWSINSCFYQTLLNPASLQEGP